MGDTERDTPRQSAGVAPCIKRSNLERFAERRSLKRWMRWLSSEDQLCRRPWLIGTNRAAADLRSRATALIAGRAALGGSERRAASEQGVGLPGGAVGLERTEL